MTMKFTATILFLFLVLNVMGQSIKSLIETGSRDTTAFGQAIIYGKFIQRLGFSSGGFPQDIQLINLNTKEVFTFRVKPAFKSAKENAFIYFIEPGHYAITHYLWTQSKWYGGKMFSEPIFKGVDATDHLEEKIKSGKMSMSDLQQFSFIITENSLNYLGTWHFDKGIVSFTDDKVEFDDSLQGKYLKLNFSSANSVLPN